MTVHLHGAGAELAPAWSRTYDGRLVSGPAHAWHDLASVVPAVEQLHGLNESYRATITVTVSSLWRDTVQLTLPVKSPIVRHLTHHAGESFRDPSITGDDSLESAPVDEVDVPVPIPADGSQLRAVAMAAEGRTFVLEGPPGTGKSQTITNLIAHALSNGKTVLFVAEKQAALDVAKKRLARVGLSDFTLDLHGKNQSANAIREQPRRAIDNTLQYNEFGWSARLAEFRSRHAPLDDYPGRIHRRNGIDDSLWRAYEAALTVGDGPSAPVPAAYVGARSHLCNKLLAHDTRRVLAVSSGFACVR
ncbi:MAG TPA: AAA domain-containing protein [Aldersonia sp.]